MVDRPTIAPIAENVPESGWRQWLAILAQRVNLLLGGKMNATNSVTLAPNATSTIFYDSRIGYFSHVTLEAQTASAATARLTAPGIWIEPTKGSATIHHPANAATDQIFSVLIIG